MNKNSFMTFTQDTIIVKLLKKELQNFLKFIGRDLMVSEIVMYHLTIQVLSQNLQKKLKYVQIFKEN